MIEKLLIQIVKKIIHGIGGNKMKLISNLESWSMVQDIVNKMFKEDKIYEIRMDREQQDTILDTYTIERKTIITIIEKIL